MTEHVRFPSLCGGTVSGMHFEVLSPNIRNAKRISTGLRFKSVVVSELVCVVGLKSTGSRRDDENTFVEQL